MNKYEVFFLELGLNWTWSKLLPYILLLLAGLLLAYFVYKKMKFNKWLRAVLAVVIFPLFFGIYFVFHPIFQGDFSNSKRVVKDATKYEQIKSDKFFVIALPNCPFCYEAMDRMMYLKKREPNLEIEYIVCSSDSSAMQWYAEKSKGKIKVKLASDPVIYSILAQNSFPAFVLKNQDASLSVWSNDNFGVRAIDEVESSF